MLVHGGFVVGWVFFFPVLGEKPCLVADPLGTTDVEGSGGLAELLFPSARRGWAARNKPGSFLGSSQRILRQPGMPRAYGLGAR